MTYFDQVPEMQKLGCEADRQKRTDQKVRHPVIGRFVINLFYLILCYLLYFPLV